MRAGVLEWHPFQGRVGERGRPQWQCTGGDCEVECHNRLYPFYSTEAQADYTLAHELEHIMLNTHNAAKSERKGPEIS
jgi:hypothetical protein